MARKRHKFHLLLHSADLLEERLRLQLAPLGLRPRQARVIDALDRMGETSQAKLAREFDVTQASMSTMTARLIAADLVQRGPDHDDPRGCLLALTEKGRNALDGIDAAWTEIDQIAAEAVGKDAFAELATGAGELRDALGGRAPGQTARRAISTKKRKPRRQRSLQ